MPDIGKRLKEARENKNITLEEAENATKIRRYYLKSLEDNNFDRLPGKVYAIGFLKTYAKYLEIDDIKEMVNELKQYFGDEENALQHPPLKKTQAKQAFLSVRIVVFALLAVILLFSLHYFYSTLERTDNDTKDITNEESIKEETENVPPAPADTEKEEDERIKESEEEINPNEVKLVVSATREKCWLRVHVDGELTYEGTLQTGEEKTFIGKKEIRVRLGNAGAVKAIFNGTVYQTLGEIGEVKVINFKLNEEPTL